jgi:hypothetical protein
MRNLSLCACLAMTGALAGPALADSPGDEFFSPGF